MVDFNGQVVIVTGAGRGMGRAIARELGRRGARVVVNDYGGNVVGDGGTPVDAAGQVVEEIAREGGEAVASNDAVGDAAAAERIVAAAVDRWGRVDGLINNAGITWRDRACDISREAMERVMATNFWGPFHLLQAVWPHMQRQQHGRIVNVMSSSILGLGRRVSYTASKAALFGLTGEAAVEGAEHNILVNNLFPSGYSRMVEGTEEPYHSWMRENFQPERMAPAVAWLVSRELDVTGMTFQAGGGRFSRVAMTNNDGIFSPTLSLEDIAARFGEVIAMDQREVLTRATDLMARSTLWIPWPDQDVPIVV